MPRVAFADESGTDANPKCYAIGVVSVAAERLDGFNSTFERLKAEHGVDQEVRWKSVSKGHGLINLSIDWRWRILRSQTARYDVIVVNTEQYRKWATRGANREDAFYTTYTYLLRHIAQQVADTTEVYIDDRPDAYDKHEEVIETIGNRMLNQLQSTGRLAHVRKVPSHLYAGIQVADILTGAIRTSHQLLLAPKTPVNGGKRLAIARLSSVLGWDALHYDTLPDSRFNIWHFPTEYRASPRTRRVRRCRELPFISATDLDSIGESAERTSVA